jgi:hypothetical protein
VLEGGEKSVELSKCLIGFISLTLDGVNGHRELPLSMEWWQWKLHAGKRIATNRGLVDPLSTHSPEGTP